MSTAPVINRAPIIEAIPASKLTDLSYWDRLDKAHQEELTATVQELSSELVGQWRSVLRVGKLVDSLYEQTNPYGAFLRTVKYLWGEFLSAATVYRYRNIYLAVREQLSESVIDVAVASGVNLVTSDPENPFGKYADVVRKLPPPKDGGVRAAKQWVEAFIEKRDKIQETGPLFEPKPPREVAKRLYVKSRNLIKMLPKGKHRVAIVEETMSYMLWEVGGISSLTVKAAAPPPEWLAIKRGRPKIKKKKEE